MVRLVTLGTCNLNQWAMDFKGNLGRIRRSIQEAKRLNCTFRVGPELEITGYGCEDHFLENDTYVHAWEALRELLLDDTTDDILCDIGMPVMHRNVGYNCRVFLLNRKVVLIRPKMFMANDGNYRELRYFTPWKAKAGSQSACSFGALEDYYLPRGVRAVCGQEKVPIGIAAIATSDTVVASETCEELFAPDSPHIKLGLDGVEIFANGSGSHHQLRKLNTRLDLIRSATSKTGGVYLYANQQGCDGGRLYYDGCSMIMINGQLVAQASQFSMNDVEVVAATIDLDEIRSHRTNNISGRMQASVAPPVPRVDIKFDLTIPTPTLAPPRDSVGSSTPSHSRPGPSCGSVDFSIRATPSKPVFEHTDMEEIAYGPSCYLWDYLRRSGQRGFFLPLSGGADSSSTAAIVALMCESDACY
jgi:NAD+ synthase (glutamine-hydrolysing)